MRPVLLILIALLSACGGGGSGSTTPPPPANLPPSLQVVAAVSVNEGETAVTTVTASDPDGDSVTLTISGADAAAFTLAGGSLEFTNPVAFANPGDANTDGVFDVTVTATDSRGAASTENVAVTIVNLLQGRVVDGPLAQGTVVLDLDGDLETDPGEPATTTDANGFFEIADTARSCLDDENCVANIIATGGTDALTGETLDDLVLFATALANDEFVVSPLSTFLAIAEDRDGLLTALGIELTVAQVLRTDPFAGDNPALAKLNQVLGLLMLTVQSLVPDEDREAAARAVADEMSRLVTLAGDIDLTDTVTVATLLAASGVSPADAATVALTLTELNALLEDIALDAAGLEVSAILRSSQSSLQEDVGRLARGEISREAFIENASALAIIDLVSDELPDLDGDGIPDLLDPDDDGDGIEDGRDTDPRDPDVVPPTAIIVTDVAGGPRPLRVIFDGSESLAGTDPASIVQYTWDFGDGETAADEVVEHIYTTPGEYTASLTVFTTREETHTTTARLSVAPFDGPVRVRGVVTVAPSLAVDSDVNDSQTLPVSNNLPAQAQPVSNPVTIGGFANAPGTGPDFDGRANLVASGDSFDTYRINAVGGEIVNLRIAFKEAGDLDLLLYDEQENLIDFSVSAARNESLTIPDAPGVYDVVVEAFTGYSNYVLSIGTDPAALSDGSATASADLVIGEVIVHGKRAAPTLLQRALVVNDRVPEAYAGPRLYRYGRDAISDLDTGFRASRTRASAVDTASDIELRLATRRLAKRLSREAGVAYAEPNFILRSSLEPDDREYDLQWHYRNINLPTAWNQTTGAAGVKIAVLDTGIARNHPDLAPRLSADGYDFVSAESGDGDGPDSDPSDPGDGRDNPACGAGVTRRSSFHGTHVAGTIGAVTNNATGVAGVTWAGQIMDVRVLGCGGGTVFDIAQGLRYAAGLDNAQGVLPGAPADIANLSLGGPTPSTTLQSAINAARAAGLIIVAAAGNNGDGALSFPASSDGVISVAATTLNDERARYSQFNARVDLAAPGGDMAQDLDGDGYPDGVLSTVAERDPTTGAITPDLAFFQGTSMAAPHVAGVIGLMKAVHPGLTPAQVDDAIASRALTVDLGPEGRDNEFGFGRIDALRAVRTAVNLASGVAPDPVPSLGLSATRLNFGRTLDERSVSAFNAGSGELAITSATASAPSVTLTGPGSLDGAGAYNIVVDRAGLAPGVYTESVLFESNAGNRTLIVQFEVVPDGQVAFGDVGHLYVFLIDWETGTSHIVEQVPNQGRYAFDFPEVAPGLYLLVAGSDPDNDGFAGDVGEAVGTYPNEDTPELLVINGDLSDLDFTATYDMRLGEEEAAAQDRAPSGVTPGPGRASGNGVLPTARRRDPPAD